MASKFIALLTGIVALVIILIDATRHGHFDPKHRRDSVLDHIEAESVPSLTNLDAKVEDRTAIISGYVDTEAERSQVTDAAL